MSLPAADVFFDQRLPRRLRRADLAAVADEYLDLQERKGVWRNRSTPPSGEAR